jgi:hypothetical protein
LVIGVALQRFGDAVDKQQEIAMRIADIVIAVFTLESALLRARKHGIASHVCAVLSRDLLDAIERNARQIIIHCCDRGMTRESLQKLHELCASPSVDVITNQREIAGQLLRTGRYSL